MVASARVAYLARRAADFEVQTGSVRVDLAKVRERKRALVESFRLGGQKKLENTRGVTLIFGEGCFTGPHEIEVSLKDGGVRRISGKVFINTGCRPAVPALPGLDQVPFLDSTSIMELEEVPRHLLVLGGGYIGLEFAQMFRRFGSALTIVQRSEQLLPREDTDVAQEVVKVLREDGIDVLLSAEAVRVERGQGSEVRLTIRHEGGERTLAGSHLLVAAGRVPNTERLGLDRAGITMDQHGYIRVNERLETGVPGVYALGDVKGGPAFTHISYDDYRILETNLLKGGSAVTTGRMVPYTVYIDPQLGHIGLHEVEARREGRNVKVAKMPMTWVARALETDESRGLVKATVDAESGQILGCSVLGLEGGEIMSMVQIAMMGRLPYTALRNATFAHPALSEGLNTLFTTLDS
jgi:pyruvate/2-oxoglutarate dehydrogenase complex dihydrolipoamide dehydrogenase (E3) component